MADRSRAPPHTGTLSNEFVEEPREVRLIRKTTFQRDLAKRGLACEHQPLRALGASAQYVPMRRLTEAALEYMREMEDADTRESGKIFNRYLCMQIGLNVARNAADLPRREAPAHI